MQYWIISVGLAFLVGAVAAEINRRRRIRAFGDPSLTGMRDGWAARIIPLLLLAAGAASITAVLSQVVPEPESRSTPLPELIFLIDPTWKVASAEDRADLMETIRTVVSQVSPSGISIFRSGSPPEKIVPKTSDAEGALLLLDRKCSAWAAPTRTSLEDSARLLAGDGARKKLVILTSMAAEEVEHLPAFSEALVIRPVEGSVVEFGALAAGGRWAWTRDAGTIRLLARRARGGDGPLSSWVRSRTRVQISAGVGFLLLTIGLLWQLAFSVRRERG
jgi:hypothetical protein